MACANLDVRAFYENRSTRTSASPAGDPHGSSSVGDEETLRRVKSHMASRMALLISAGVFSLLLWAIVIQRPSPLTVAAPAGNERDIISCSHEEEREGRDPVALGVFIPGVKDDPSKIDRFSRAVGGQPTVVMWFQDWVRNGTFDPAGLDAVSSRGAMPMVTWEPWDHTAGPRQPTHSLQAIASGRHDAYVRRWARAADAYNKPFYLRFAHEMNGNWFSWATNVNGNTPEQYVAAWRRVHGIFRQEGATNVRWVWAPEASRHFDRTLYPGDAYVDWVALDGYNFGPSYAWWSEWSEFESIFGEAYGRLATITDKPVMIAETASAESGGDKAAWIRQGLLRDVPEQFPRVRAVVWFHTAKERNWRVDSSPRSLAAYREAVRSPLYEGRLC